MQVGFRVLKHGILEQTRLEVIWPKCFHGKIIYSPVQSMLKLSTISLGRSFWFTPFLDMNKKKTEKILAMFLCQLSDA